MCLCVHPCVPLSNMYIFEASRPIAFKSCLKHHWGGGKAALGFGPYQSFDFHGNRKLPYGYNWENGVATFFSAVFYPILFILACKKDMHERSEEFKVRPDRTQRAELGALERLKNTYRI